MKQFAILLTLLCCWSVTSVVVADDNTGKTPIIPISRGLSVHLPACSIAVNSGNVVLCANMPLDNIQIIVEDETGSPVYQANESADKGQSILIDTGGWSNGTYYIIITDSEGSIIQQEAIRY